MENNEEINDSINAIMESENTVDNIDLKTSFEYILKNYDKVCRLTSNNEGTWDENHVNFFNFFIYDFSRYLKKLSKDVSDEFKIIKSYTYSKLSVLPYYGLSFQDHDDFFIYYLFSYDLSELYLTLGLKVEGREVDSIKTNIFKRLILQKYNEKDLDFTIQDDGNINLKVQEILDCINSGNLPENLPENTDLDKEKDRLNRQLEKSKNYKEATVFSKKYDKDNIPDDETLKKDLYEFLKLYKFIYDEQIFYKINDFELNHNLIYFGAPGTGKSFKLENDKKCLINDNDCFERVTFHPDYSYANFVGTYKPVSDENDDIRYKYVEGPFMRILKEALKEENNDKNYLLIIEEINRANVAAVFGDVFQLLDRDESGYSRYEISLSNEASDYLGKKKIKIPPNLYIWATMNSADQGVFPMDTAFKRRWDFEYLDINNDQEKIENLKFTLNDKEIYSWNKLRKAINDELLKNKVNEDKLIGPFFAFNEFIGNDCIPSLEFKKTFKYKIIMYLFEDVLKSRSNKLFSGIDDKYLTFGKICKKFNEVGLDIFSQNIQDYAKIEVNNSVEQEAED